MKKRIVQQVLPYSFATFCVATAGYMVWYIMKNLPLLTDFTILASGPQSYYRLVLYILSLPFILLIIAICLVRVMTKTQLEAEKLFTVYMFVTLVLISAPIALKLRANYDMCLKFFTSCSYVWHREKNKFGHSIDVHVLVDSKGNKLGAVGKTFNGGFKEYKQIMDSLKDVTIESEDDEKIVYLFPSGHTAILKKTDVAPLEMNDLTAEEQSLINTAMFSSK